MPLSLSAMQALLTDGGKNTADEVRDIVEALYDWIPSDVRYMSGRLPGETAHAADDFFTAYSGYTEQTPTGTAVWAAGHGGLGVKFDDQAANDFACTLKAIPGGPPLTIQTAWSGITSTGSNPGLGLVFADGTGSGANIAAFGDLAGFGAAPFKGTITSVDTSLGAVTVVDRTNLRQGLIHVRLIWKSANTFAWAYSLDGSVWTDFNHTDQTITMTPTHMGLFATTWSQTAPMTAVFRYLRVNEVDGSA